MTNLATQLPHRTAFDAALPEIEDRIREHERELIAAKVRGNWPRCDACRAVLDVLRPMKESLQTQAMYRMQSNCGSAAKGE